MLREAEDARFVRKGMWFWKRYVFHADTVRSARGITQQEYEAAVLLQTTRAVSVLDTGARRYWWCLGRFYWEDAGLADADVYALALER